MLCSVQTKPFRNVLELNARSANTCEMKATESFTLVCLLICFSYDCAMQKDVLFNKNRFAKQQIYKLHSFCTHVHKVGTFRILV